MDETDSEILRLLQENARTTLAHISGEIGLSSPSIKDRIEKMEREGVILGYRPVLDYRKLGKGLTAFVHLTLVFPQCCNDELAEALKTLPGVVEGHYTDGDYDVFLKVVTESPESLRDVLNLINGVEGVANTKTIISLTNPIREF
jgi:Lrp/AsnC family transcriptional regulator for asnA, asnC and gidA